MRSLLPASAESWGCWGVEGGGGGTATVAIAIGFTLACGIESRAIEGEDVVGGQVTPVSLVLPRPEAAQWHLGHGCNSCCCFARLL